MEDENKAQFCKLPFGGRYVSRAVDQIVPSKSGLPHITNALNESYLSNILSHQENDTLSRKEPRNFKPELNETEFADALQNLKSTPVLTIQLSHISQTVSTEHTSKTF
jgi:hypothetical protein